MRVAVLKDCEKDLTKNHITHHVPSISRHFLSIWVQLSHCLTLSVEFRGPFLTTTVCHPMGCLHHINGKYASFFRFINLRQFSLSWASLLALNLFKRPLCEIGIQICYSDPWQFFQGEANHRKIFRLSQFFDLWISGTAVNTREQKHCYIDNKD